MKTIIKNQLVAFTFLLGSSILSAQEINTKMYFKAGEYDLNDRQREQLTNLLYSIDGESFTFEFIGYTDNVGAMKTNKYLSRLRAENINLFVKKLCLPTSNTSVKGIGEINAYDGPKEKKNDENRRVDIRVTYSVTSNKNKLIKNREACLRGEYVNETTNVVNLKNQIPPQVEVREVIKEVIVERPGRGSKTFEEEVPKGKDLKAGDKLIFRGINFMPGSAKLMKTSIPILSRLLGMMEDNPTIKINISGHVCCGVPKDKEEQLEVDKLSENRAREVRNYLIDNNIGQDRIKYEGKGFNEPIIAEEKNSYDQEKNRRVEIEIIQK